MTIKEKLKALKDTQAEIKEELKIWVKDRSISLDERWSVFLNSEMGESDPYYKSFESFAVPDDFRYIPERYRNITVESIYEELLEKEEEEQLDSSRSDAFREEVLEMFLDRFVWNW